MDTPRRTKPWLAAVVVLGGVGTALVAGAATATADSGPTSSASGDRDINGASVSIRKATTARSARSAPAVVPRAQSPNRPLRLARSAPRAAATLNDPAESPTAAFTSDGWGDTSYLPDNEVIVPGSAVLAARQQISMAQDVLHSQTWGAGNVVAGLASIAPQVFLAQAAWGSSEWQNNIEAAKALVAQTEGAPIAHELAQLSLLGALMLPTMAGIALDAAKVLTPLVGVFGGQQTAQQADQLIGQAKTNGQVYAVRLLRTVSRTQEVVYVSVNGGLMVPVQLDTGSSGLTILGKYVPEANRGESTGSGQSGYGGDSGSVQYDYHSYNLTLDFGGGAVTAPGRVLIVDPESEAVFDNYGTAGTGTVGTLGVAANQGGGPTLNALLPGELRDGILIYQNIIGPWGLVIFGPNPLPSRGVVAGAPVGDIQLQINDAPPQPFRINIDSGGIYGGLPAPIVGDAREGNRLKPGTVITAYSADGKVKLYSYAVNDINSPEIYDPVISPGNQPLTGGLPFELGPIYLDYSAPGRLGATHFDFF